MFWETALHETIHHERCMPSLTHSLHTPPGGILSAPHTWGLEKQRGLLKDTQLKTWSIVTKGVTRSIILIMLFLYLKSFRIPITLRAKSTLPCHQSLHNLNSSLILPLSESLFRSPWVFSVLWRNETHFLTLLDLVFHQAGELFPTFYHELPPPALNASSHERLSLTPQFPPGSAASGTLFYIRLLTTGFIVCFPIKL